MQELQIMPQTELAQLEIINVQPAEIDFNFYEMKLNLENYIETYNSLVITADGIPRAKKDLAELNKLKKTIDDFRIKTKKDASKNITAFEDDCKILTGMITTAHAGIKEQVDTFEEQRRIERQKEVQNLIDKALEKSTLPQEYKAKITIKSEYLNISNTNAKITQDLEYDISVLELEHAQEMQKKELIDSLCEVQNQKHGLQIPLDPVHYYRYDLDQAKEAIEQAGARAKQAQEDAIRRIEAQAKEKAEREARAKLEAEQERIEVEKAQAKIQEPQQEIVQEIIQPKTTSEAMILSVKASPMDKIDLLAYLDSKGIEYSIL